MSITQFPAPKLRLSRLLARSGGLSVSDALAAAEARLAEAAPTFAAALDEALEKLARLAEALATAPVADPALAELYAAAEQVLGLAGPAGQADLGKAAYSLCDLLDRFQSGAAFKPAAVRVHLEAIRTLRRPPQAAGGPAVRRVLLDGLAQVVRSVV